MKVKKYNIKIIEYKNKNLYLLNNIDKEKLNEYSEFPIGSTTKVFTMISLLLLHQNKQININNTFEKYLDNKELAKVKIIDVINHVSGIKNMYNNVMYGSSKKKYKCTTEVYNDYSKEKLITQKIGDMNYSCVGYIILGALIENITNEKYIDYVKNNILIPLKMENTSDKDTNITLYDYNGKILNKYQKQERTFASSSGILKSCIYDLIKFSKFPKLLTKDSLKLLSSFYIFNKYNISHVGYISGGYALIDYTYDNLWKIKQIAISLKTIN